MSDVSSVSSGGSKSSIASSFCGPMRYGPNATVAGLIDGNFDEAASSSFFQVPGSSPFLERGSALCISVHRPSVCHSWPREMPPLPPVTFCSLESSIAACLASSAIDHHDAFSLQEALREWRQPGHTVRLGLPPGPPPSSTEDDASAAAGGVVDPSAAQRSALRACHETSYGCASGATPDGESPPTPSSIASSSAFGDAGKYSSEPQSPLAGMHKQRPGAADRARRSRQDRERAVAERRNGFASGRPEFVHPLPGLPPHMPPKLSYAEDANQGGGAKMVRSLTFEVADMRCTLVAGWSLCLQALFLDNTPPPLDR